MHRGQHFSPVKTKFDELFAPSEIHGNKIPLKRAFDDYLVKVEKEKNTQTDFINQCTDLMDTIDDGIFCNC